MKKVIEWLKAVACILAIYILIIIPASKNIFISSIGIKASNQKSEYATGNRITIKYISFNGVKQKAASLHFISSDSMTVNEDGYGINLSGGQLEFRSPLLSSVELAFETNKDCGYVLLKDVKRNRKINLVSSSQGTLYCHPSIMKSYYSFGLMLFVLILLIFTRFLLKCLDDYLKKNRKNVWSLFNNGYFWLILIFTISRIFWIQYIGMNVESYDSPGYEQYFMKGMANTNIRTPLYPLFLKILSIIFEEKYLLVAVLIQMAVGILSGVYLYKTALLMLSNPYFAYIIAILYGCFPFQLFFEHSIGPDSFGSAIGVFLVYFIAKFLKKPSRRLSFYISLSSFFCIMLRPSFLFVLVIFLAFWIIRAIVEKSGRIISIYGILGAGLAMLCLMGYCTINYFQFGNFEIGKVATEWNLGYALTSQNIYDNENDPEFSDDITRYKYTINDNYWYYVNQLDEKYTSKLLQQKLENTRNINKYEYEHYILNKVVSGLDSGLFHNIISENDSGWKGTMVKVADNGLPIEKFLNMLFCPINMMQIYILLVIQIVLFIVKIVKEKTIYWLDLGIAGVGLGNIVTAYLGAYSDYQRLMLPFLCVYYLIPFNILQYVIQRKVGEK